MQRTKLSRLASTERIAPLGWGHAAHSGDPASTMHVAPIAFLPEYEQFRAELFAEPDSDRESWLGSFANATTQQFAPYSGQAIDSISAQPPVPPGWLPTVTETKPEPFVTSVWNGAPPDQWSGGAAVLPAGSPVFGSIGPNQPFQTTGASPADIAFAGLGKRVLAFLIDGVVLFVLALMTTIATMSAGIVTVETDRRNDTAASGDWGSPAVLWAWTIYLVLFTAWGGTIGHRTTGLRVRTTDGAMPGIAAGVIRSGIWIVVTLVVSAMAFAKQNGADPDSADEWALLAWLVLTGLFVLGCLPALVDKRRQTILDKCAGTIVVTASSLSTRASISPAFAPGQTSAIFAPTAGLFAKKMLTSGLGFQSAAAPNARRYNILYAARLIIRAIFRSI